MSDVKIVSPVEPHELGRCLRHEMERIVQRVTTKSAIEGQGQDVLLRIYMAGVYHGMKLQAERAALSPQDPAP